MIRIPNAAITMKEGNIMAVTDMDMDTDMIMEVHAAIRSAGCGPFGGD